MNMSTKNKIRIATLLYRIVSLLRHIIGRSDIVICKRQGINWELDLRQGIDLYIYLRGTFEVSTARTLKIFAKPEMHVLDIGANIGAHTLHLAKSVGDAGQVYAIEPSNWAFSKLKRNCELNPELIKRITPIQAALLDEITTMPDSFFSSWDLIDEDNLAKEKHNVHCGVKHSASSAHKTTLDNLVTELNIPRIDLIKLDVDGFETHVITGGKNSLKKFLPTIIVELCPYAHEEQGSSFEKLLELFSEMQYRLLDEITLKELSFDANKLKKSMPEGGGINVIAAHYSKLEGVRSLLR